MASYLPVPGLELKQHRVLRLAHVTLITILNLFGALLGLDAIILGKGALVAGSSSVSEEMRTNRLDAALNSLGELANSLEVLLSAPVAGKRGKG